MKKMFIALFVLSVLFTAGNVFAQHTAIEKGDTLVVPPYRPVDALLEGETEADTLFNSMIYFIAGDTNTDGTQKHKVYELVRNANYILNTYGNDYKNELELYAPMPDDQNRPPVISIKIPEDWSFAGPWVSTEASLTCKNIYFNAYDHTDLFPAWAGIETYGEDNRYVIDNCYFEYNSGLPIYINTANSVTIVKNCHVRNLTSPQGSIFVGQFCVPEAVAIDTLLMQNNTMFNGGAWVTGFVAVKNFIFDHNTIYNLTTHPINSTNHTHSIITNNIFMNCGGYGATDEEITQGGELVVGGDLVISSIINIDTLGGEFATTFGEEVLEADRVCYAANNAYFVDQELKDFHAAYNANTYPWMNERTQAMFDANDSYPGLEEENNFFDQDPGFTMVGGLESMIEYCKALRDSLQPGTTWGYDTDSLLIGADLPWHWFVGWPLPEDLSYSNETLLTGSQYGFPIGDLNWFPDAMAAWEEYLTGVDYDNVAQPVAFSLNQNYPNPFNPTTRISFNLERSGFATLTVFNVLGQQVATVLAKNLTAGAHEVDFDASELSNGLYYYQLEFGDQKMTKKMMVLK